MNPPSHPRPLLRALAVPAALLSFVSAPSAARAQSAGHLPAVVELPSSSRAVGLGHAFQLDARDSDALFYNPGLLEGAGGMMAGYHRLGHRSSTFTLSAVTGWYGGGVGVGVQALDHGTLVDAGDRPGGLDPFLSAGETVVSERVATVGYARGVGPVDVGVAGKLMDLRHGGSRETTGAVDVGVATRMGDLRVGLSAQNLGPESDFAGSDVGKPERFTLGAGGYGLRLGPLDMGLAAAVSHRADGQWIGGGGVEIGYWPVIGRTFVVRVGGRNVPEGDASPVTVGASYWGDDLVLEYAFQPMGDLDGIHRVSVGWR